jgi:hypothetical protein
MKGIATNTHLLMTELKQHIQNLRLELKRLEVRQLAGKRYHQQVMEQLKDSESEEDESFDEIVSYIESLEADLANFQTQTKDRLAHLTQGQALLNTFSDIPQTRAFAAYILEDARLCVRDTKTALEGYDEILASIASMTHERE